MAVADHGFRAMGCDCRVLVSGPHAATLARQGEERVAQIERRWSRFIDDSEISRMNEAGALCIVSDDTFQLVSRSVDAWYLTGGLFDPTVLDRVEALGYDRDFADIGDVAGDGPTGGPSPGCSAIELYPHLRAVRLPAGVRFDPGGLGKGLAGDLVAALLIACGASGVLVDLGGDVVMAGQPPSGGPWTVAVEHPLAAGRDLTHLQIDAGAVATSSTLLRRWQSDGRTVHHLVDPHTGSNTTGTISATAVAGAGWWAEAVATASMVGGGPLRDADASVLTVDRTGRVDASHDLVAAVS